MKTANMVSADALFNRMVEHFETGAECYGERAFEEAKAAQVRATRLGKAYDRKVGETDAVQA